MNNIIRQQINYMVDHARSMSKAELRRGNKDNFYKFMERSIKTDFDKAEGAISALSQIGVISFAEWRRDRQVLKYHYCRLVGAYCGMECMTKEHDKNFYWVYIS